MRFSAAELTAHLGGELVGPDVSVEGASIDSRTIRPGQLYAPIVAERALRLGANANNPALTRKEAVTLIRGAGLLPCERMADGSLQEVTP